MTDCSTSASDPVPPIAVGYIGIIETPGPSTCGCPSGSSGSPAEGGSSVLSGAGAGGVGPGSVLRGGKGDGGGGRRLITTFDLLRGGGGGGCGCSDTGSGCGCSDSGPLDPFGPVSSGEAAVPAVFQFGVNNTGGHLDGCT